jgi:hypothetical protein
LWQTVLQRTPRLQSGYLPAWPDRERPTRPSIVVRISKPGIAQARRLCYEGRVCALADASVQAGSYFSTVAKSLRAAANSQGA